MDEIVVFITCPTQREAEKIGRSLVENRLAACANIVPSITSIFSWEAKTCREEEVLMLVKSRKAVLKKMIVSVKRQHSYSLPEIIALPIVGGSEDYLNWILENTR
ncbi:MAG: divalent-cation tolerance protein CutA [Nitrospiria bacterium]